MAGMLVGDEVGAVVVAVAVVETSAGADVVAVVLRSPQPPSTTIVTTTIAPTSDMRRLVTDVTVGVPDRRPTGSFGPLARRTPAAARHGWAPGRGGC